jgi:hypothetical protein
MTPPSSIQVEVRQRKIAHRAAMEIGPRRHTYSEGLVSPQLKNRHGGFVEMANGSE